MLSNALPGIHPNGHNQQAPDVDFPDRRIPVSTFTKGVSTYVMILSM